MNVVLADDHAMVREGLRAVLEKAGVCVVGEAANGREAVAIVLRLRPDVVVMDITMPGLNGVDAARRLTNELPSTKILGLSMNADRRYVTAMMAAGAAGYVLKNAAAEELLEALKVVTSGGEFFSPGIDGRVISTDASGRRTAEKNLTFREREVLQLVAEGKSSKEIGAQLNIALPTVETHRRQIMDKLGLRSIAELTKYAIREGLTSAEG
jgi:two-component system, NarL family, response regulator LiaR